MILQVPSVNEDWSNDSESMLAWLSTFVILPLRFGMYKICDITRRNTCSLVVQLSTSVKTISINSVPYNFHLKGMECPPLYISHSAEYTEVHFEEVLSISRLMKHPWVYFEDVRLLLFVLSRQYEVRPVVLLLQDNQGGPEPL